MKKKLLIIALVLCFAIVFVSCTNNAVTSESENTENAADAETEALSESESGAPEIKEPTVVNVAALKGPTAMGLVALMDAEENNAGSDYLYDFDIEAAVDAISPLLIQGKLDMAAVPANLASVLYNNTQGEVLVLNINTLGVLYIVENGNSVNTMEDLKGKTIYASGKGATPEYALNYLLKSAGLEIGRDVFVEYKSEHAEALAAMVSEPNAVAMLPQPFVTTAQMTNESVRIALDVTKEWETASGKTLITGVMAVRKSFAEAHPDAVADFMNKYEQSVKYVNENVADAALLIEKYDIFKSDVAEKAIPYCNITYIDGEEMKEKLSEYLETLYEQNPASVGGKLPEDDFYYAG